MKRAGRLLAMVMLASLAGCASAPSKQLKATLAQQQQAQQAYDSGHPEQALAGYQALVRELPQNADFWFRLGNVYVRLDRPDEAVDAYQHALRIEPDHAKAWHNLGIIRLRQSGAAFAQSARLAAGVDATLQHDSAAMAQGIGTLGAKPPTADAAPASPSSAPAPSPLAAGAGQQP